MVIAAQLILNHWFGYLIISARVVVFDVLHFFAFYSGREEDVQVFVFAVKRINLLRFRAGVSSNRLTCTGVKGGEKRLVKKRRVVCIWFAFSVT